jgi:hypothetical protein
MRDARTGAARTSVLSLEFQVLDGQPDWPVVRVLIDGTDLFAAVSPGWHGFDPSNMLGPHSPLLPDDLGRRVAIYRCSCGEAGCGVIAPVIMPSPDGRWVSWVDFRDYVGVFVGPVAESVAGVEGTPWEQLADLHFERDQYVAEIERASRDDSWETRPRRTARLLHERLAPLSLVLPPDLPYAWASPAGAEEGIEVMFEHFTRTPPYQVRQRLLRLTSGQGEPSTAAADMADQLLSTNPADWASRFGRQPR